MYLLFNKTSFYLFRKLKSSHALSSSKMKYSDDNKTISLSSQMQKDPSAVRRDEREDNYSDKSHRKTPQQKQSSHSCNASNRGNCVHVNCFLVLITSF